MFIFFVGFLVFNFYNPKNILVASKFTPIDYKVENQLFVKECASCHTLYPPNLLPKKSWELLMSDLENHFGDDASIPEDSNKEILAFLVKNSAENSTMQSSFKFLNSIKNQDIITMTKTTFWEKTHKEIPKEIFENSEVKSKANCKACHSDIEKGLPENSPPPSACRTGARPAWPAGHTLARSACPEWRKTPTPAGARLPGGRAQVPFALAPCAARAAG